MATHEVAYRLTGCGKSLKRMQCAQFSNIQRGSTSNYISTMHVFVDKYYRPCPFSAACLTRGEGLGELMTRNADSEHWARVSGEWIKWARAPNHDAFWA